MKKTWSLFSSFRRKHKEQIKMCYGSHLRIDVIIHGWSTHFDRHPQTVFSSKLAAGVTDKSIALLPVLSRTFCDMTRLTLTLFSTFPYIHYLHLLFIFKFHHDPTFSRGSILMYRLAPHKGITMVSKSTFSHIFRSHYLISPVIPYSTIKPS